VRYLNVFSEYSFMNNWGNGRIYSRVWLPHCLFIHCLPLPLSLFWLFQIYDITSSMLYLCSISSEIA